MTQLALGPTQLAPGTTVRLECCNSTDRRGNRDLSRVAARVLGLHEEGIFRTIIGFV